MNLSLYYYCRIIKNINLFERYLTLIIIDVIINYEELIYFNELITT